MYSYKNVTIEILTYFLKSLFDDMFVTVTYCAMHSFIRSDILLLLRVIQVFIQMKKDKTLYHNQSLLHCLPIMIGTALSCRIYNYVELNNTSMVKLSVDLMLVDNYEHWLFIMPYHMTSSTTYSAIYFKFKVPYFFQSV